MVPVNKIRGGQIYGFDLLKIIMACLIVAVHARAFENPILNQWMAPLMNVSVPLFFVLSSFFMFRKLGITEQPGWNIFKGFAFRLILLYAFWFFVNLPLYIHESGFIHMPITETLRRTLIDATIGNTFHGSWFISALLLGCTVIYLVHLIGKSAGVILVMAYAYMFTQMPNVLPASLIAMREWISNQDCILTLTFFRGIYCVGIGYLLSKKHIDKTLQKVPLYMSAILSLLIYFILVFVSQNHAIIFAFIISLYALAYNLKLEPSNTYKHFRNLSILFYLLHFNICGFFHKAFPAVDWLYSGVFFYAIVLAVVLAIAEFILWAEKQKGLSWLKYSH